MSAVPEQWELVIGLEIHIRLATDSNLFSGSPRRSISLCPAPCPS